MEESKQVKAGQLYIVATPIGNLEDITMRALRILNEVDFIAAEDTRQISKLCQHYKIEEVKFSLYHDHNQGKAMPEILDLLKNFSVALVSDAGTPLISDPGYKLVRACLAHNFQVIPIPGATSIITALSASGLPTDQFTFLGFLPRTTERKLKMLEPWKNYPGTLVFFESPHRILYTIKDLHEAFDGQGQLVIGRELTKLHEEFVRGSFKDVLENLEKKAPRGEYVILWHP